MAQEDDVLAIANELKKDIARVITILTSPKPDSTKIAEALAILQQSDQDIEAVAPEPPPTP